MACGCTEVCNCSVLTSATVSWTGSGTIADPYIATVIPAPTGGLYNTVSGVAILLDPASPAVLSTSAAGLSVACCPIAPVDSNCIDFTVIDETTFTADLIIDPASPATVTCGPDGLSVDCCGEPLAFVPTGLFAPYGGTTAPAFWALCDGTVYDSIADPTYAPLYAVIGNTYGGTDGTDFQVPNECDLSFVPPGTTISQPFIIKL